MKIIPENKKKFSLWIIGIATVCILLFVTFQNLDSVSKAISTFADIISPLLLGFFFSLILNVPMSFFESFLWKKTKKPLLIKLRRPFSFIISLAIILGIIAGMICLVIPELVASFKIIIQGATDIINKLKTDAKIEFAGIPIGEFIEATNWDELIEKAQGFLKDQGGNIVNTAFSTISNLIGGVFNFFISFVFAIYILFSKDKLKNQSRRFIGAWLPQKASETILHICAVAGKNFSNFISGQTLEAVILGTLCMIGMFILRIPYAPMVGVLVGITALVPVVGGFIGAGVGAFMILTVSPVKALIFVIYLVILQQLENNLIYPKVMGSKVNLPALWILAAVTVGGGVGGVFGMLLSVPVASTAYVLIKEATLKRENTLRQTNEESYIENVSENSEICETTEIHKTDE